VRGGGSHSGALRSSSARLLSLRWRPQIRRTARDPAKGSTRMACDGGLHEDGVRWRDPRGWRAAAGSMRRGHAASSSSVNAFFSFLGALLYLSPSHRLSLSSWSSIFSTGRSGGGRVFLVVACGGDGVLVACGGDCPGDGMRWAGGVLGVLLVTSTEVQRRSAMAGGQWARAVRFCFFILFPNLCQELDRTHYTDFP
jgi:hypothetical protein